MKPLTESERKIVDFIDRQPLKYRLGNTCLVSEWMPISDKSQEPFLESLPNVIVRDGQCRRFWEVNNKK